MKTKTRQARIAIFKREIEKIEHHEMRDTEAAKALLPVFKRELVKLESYRKGDSK